MGFEVLISNAYPNPDPNPNPNPIPKPNPNPNPNSAGEGIVITDCGAIGFMTSSHHWKHPNGTVVSPLQATV